MVQTVVQPEYAVRFSCITSECDDICCRGWKVSIERESDENFQRLERAGHRLFQGSFIRDHVTGVPGVAAEFALADGQCVFLDQDGLCRMQKEFGEGFLAAICALFPRRYALVNGRLELSLDMACPHAARLALTDTSPMRFVSVDTEVDPRVYRMPHFDADAGDDPHEACPRFDELRAFVIALLQDRRYGFEDRLLILSRFCRDLDAVPLTCDADVLTLTGTYAQKLHTRRFHAFISSISGQPHVFLRSVVSLLEYRLKMSAVGERFADCFDDMKKGFGDADNAADGTAVLAYSRIKAGLYERFLESHSHIFENYFVNAAFRSLFPVGARHSIYGKDAVLVPRTVMTELMRLVIQYAMLKALIAGACGRHGRQPDTAEAIRIFQAFSKNVAADEPYLQTVLKLFHDHGILDLAHAAMLVKS